MAKGFEWMDDSNRSANPSIHDISGPARRVLVLGGIGVLTVGALAPWLEGRAAGRFRQLQTSALGRLRTYVADSPRVGGVP